MEELLTRDLGDIPSLVWEIIVDPASKPVEAMLVFGIIIVLLAMVLLAVLLLISRSDDEEEGESALEDEPAGSDAVPAPVGSAAADVPRAPRKRRPLWPVILVGLVAWWLATGFTTSVPTVCMSCHADSAHATSKVAEDPHGELGCVSCHESGGWLAALTTGVPERVGHIVTAIASPLPAGEYGYVAGASCGRCHDGDIVKTTTNELKAVRVSHKEPLDAGAECVDCHIASDGVIGASTTGMQPCLRCHNDTDAPADCAYCHVGDIALAVDGRSVPTSATAQALVSDPQCGGCHSQETCDACHGLRMPHTQQFMAYAHAREGVEDIWYNGGQMCGKCHYDGNRPCTGCHLGRFPSHGSGFARTHGASGAANSGCDSCHAVMTFAPGRDFCVDLCHTGG